MQVTNEQISRVMASLGGWHCLCKSVDVVEAYRAAQVIAQAVNERAALRLELDVYKYRDRWMDGEAKLIYDVDKELSPTEMLHTLTTVRGALDERVRQCGEHLERIGRLEAENAMLRL